MNRRTMQRLAWTPDWTGHTGTPLPTLQVERQTRLSNPDQWPPMGGR